MKILIQRHAIILAALLQVLPLIRNFFVNPATGSTLAFIFRWGIGSAAAIGTVDAVSGATNKFTSTNVFTGTVGQPLTNNLTLQSTKGDPGSFSVITSNSVSVVLSTSGQSTNFALPPGLVLEFIDSIKANSTNPAFDAIHGTPTAPGTNTFTVSLEYESFIVSTNITVQISAAAVLSPPVITNNPTSITNLAGGTSTFTVTAGPPPVAYQWFFDTNNLVGNATNSSLTITNTRLSQAGTYSVVVTNTGGAVTSAPAVLSITPPPPPTITTSASTATPGATFQFTFNPVAGLTNTVQTNAILPNGTWGTLTNVAPPVTTNAITIIDPIGAGDCFYRIQVVP